MPTASGVPKKIRAQTAADYLEVLTKAVFQAGISWRVVDAKWPGFREAFVGFDAEKLARFTGNDVERLAGDTRIIRNRRKIEATIDNAAELLEIEKEFGTVRRYLRSHDDFEDVVADLRKRFRFLGDTGAYYFLYVVGERVPVHSEWEKSRHRETTQLPRG